MRYVTLDNICRSVLMQRGYSLHWYLQALKASSDCLRELTFDSLKNVNTVKLPVGPESEVDLPCDYVDWVKIGLSYGQYVRPLVQKEGINRLQNLDNSGQPENYPDPTPELSEFNLLTSGMYNGYYWANSFTSDGQMLGKWFGFNAGNLQDGFKVIRERNQIQLDQNMGADFIILEYISDGQNSDAATTVHPYAQKCIESYVMWMFLENNRSVGGAERQRAQDAFSTQRRILRARLNGLSAADIVRASRKGFSATIKG